MYKLSLALLSLILELPLGSITGVVVETEDGTGESMAEELVVVVSEDVEIMAIVSGIFRLGSMDVKGSYTGGGCFQPEIYFGAIIFYDEWKES